MSQAAALIMPTLPTPKSLLFSSSSSRRRSSVLVGPTIAFAGRARNCFGRAASSSMLVVVGGGDAISGLDRCFLAPPDFGPVMKSVQYSAFGAATLEKSELHYTTTMQDQTESSPEIATGGGGGDNGKGLGCGDGNGGGRDDDDNYFQNFDDGDEADEGGLFRKRIILEQLFDRKFVDSVLNEWGKVMMDLPAGFRLAYEMGLVSSAEMVEFLATNARPTIARLIARSLPQGLSREFNGRLIADPAFLHRLLLEQATTFGFTLCSEMKNRGERIKQEWRLVLIRTLTVTACNAFFFIKLAPHRSYKPPGLPNNIFEKNYPLSEFDLRKRFQSFLCNTAAFCMVGVAARVVIALSTLAATKKEVRLSETIPSAFAEGARFGLSASIRYQLLCGFERLVIDQFDVIGVSLFFCATMRVLNVQLGETWLPLGQSNDNLKAYNRPSEGVSQSSKWFQFKKAIVSASGIKQGQNDDSEAPLPKGRRKRVVKRKVLATI